MRQYVITIAEKNNIREQFKEAKSGVNGDRVFLSEGYVIKFFEGRKKKYYPNELLIYSQLDFKYRSSLIDYGDIDGINYIVLTKSKGETLYSIWDELSLEERKNSVSQIADILKAISNILEPKILDFRKEIKQQYFETIRHIKLKTDTKKQIQHFFEHNITFLSQTEKCYLTYIDVHFDNFLYNNGVIKAIDFEALKYAPLDYQMDRWCRMSRHPEIYANEFDKTRVIKSNYTALVGLMKEFYPEAFNFKAEEERLHLYSLVYNLNVIKKHNIPEDAIIELLKEDMFLEISFT